MYKFGTKRMLKSISRIIKSLSTEFVLILVSDLILKILRMKSYFEDLQSDFVRFISV